jgi:hypothetical protein
MLDAVASYTDLFAEVKVKFPTTVKVREVEPVPLVLTEDPLFTVTDDVVRRDVKSRYSVPVDTTPALLDSPYD